MVMNVRIKTKQFKDGKWAVFTGERYYLNTVSDTELQARIKGLQAHGRRGQDMIDAADRELEKLGALDPKDPHGYLC